MKLLCSGKYKKTGGINMEIKLASTNDFVSKKMISVEKEGKLIITTRRIIRSAAG